MQKGIKFRIYPKRNVVWHNSSYYGRNYTLKAGDVVFYGYNKNKSNHEGLIVAASVNGYLQVLEGECAKMQRRLWGM